MKKIIFLVFSLSLVLNLFVACDKKPNSGLSEKLCLDQGKEIVWVVDNYAKPSDRHVELLNKRLKEKGYDYYIKLKVVEYIEPNGTETLEELKTLKMHYEDEIMKMKDNNQQVDIISACEFENRDIYYPLDDYFKTEEGQKLYEFFPSEKILEASKVNGKTVMLPLNFNNKLNMGFKYAISKNNENINPNNFKKFAWKFSESNNKVYVDPEIGTIEYMNYECDVVAPCQSSEYYDLICSTVGVATTSKNLYVYNIFEDEYMRESLKSKNYYANVGKQSNIIKLTEFCCEPSKPYTYLSDEENNTYQVVPMFEDIYISENYSNGNAIASWSENKKEALELLSLLYTNKEIAMISQYGEEGTDYVIDENGYVDIINYAGYNPNNTFVSQWSVASCDKDEPLNIREFDKKRLKEAKFTPLCGFKFDSEKVEKEIRSTSKVLDKYAKNLFWGKGNFEKLYNELLKDLKQAGIEKIVKEANKQIEMWKGE